jgi:hypothetical protein
MNPLQTLIAEAPILPSGAVVLVLAVAAVSVARYRRRRRLHPELPPRLAAGCERLRDVLLPDGLGGALHIDHLLLAPDRILVLDIKCYDGYLFGGVQLETWTQLLDGRSYRFANPLAENELRTSALRSLVPDVPVTGCVVFVGGGGFPKGRPEGICTVQMLEAALAPRAGAARRPRPELLAAWARIQGIAAVEAAKA